MPESEFRVLIPYLRMVYPNTNDNVHVHRLGVAAIMKFIIEVLNGSIDEAVMITLTKRRDINFDTDGIVFI